MIKYTQDFSLKHVKHIICNVIKNFHGNGMTVKIISSTSHCGVMSWLNRCMPCVNESLAIAVAIPSMKSTQRWVEN